MGWLILHVVAIFCIALVLLLIALILFEPGLRYRINPRRIALDSSEFLRLLGALCDAQVHACDQIDVLNNGESFYPVELAAIAAATQTIHVEAFIFRRGDIASQFIAALSERARSGVRVKVIIDAIGSFRTPDSFFEPLRQAGAQVVWYQPLRLFTFKRWNNRTHRKLIIIDGMTAFCGGADIGDLWLNRTHPQNSWRDTVCRFRGELVTGLQSTFAENWVEAAGDILADDDYFPETREAAQAPEERASGIVVNSTPSAARGTRAHILYQTLLACAEKTVDITTPYFLPDRSTLDEIVKAVSTRGVKVRVITPGKHSNHLVARASSRRRYGELLQAGAEIYEYQPSMIHAKTMVIDALWAVVGSTNFDNRSFGLNDEVNVAVRDRRTALRLEDDFAHDLEKCLQITYDDWKNRSAMEKLLEPFFHMFDRQF